MLEQQFYFCYLKYILLTKLTKFTYLLTYFKLSMIFNAGFPLLLEYVYSVYLLLK